MTFNQTNNGQSVSDYNYCALPLASYACRPDQSQGRLYPEPASAHRNSFQRDRDRIIHASAFRRLKYKTQVFVYHEGDHYRTRLTHTLEVAQITRTLARALMANEDLAEAIALAHDLGHTPFAHIGEIYLDRAMQPFGGFDHNDQSLRILTTLEHRYPKWEGLNLSWETLEGVAKHNGPVAAPLTPAISELNSVFDLRLTTFAALEAQIAALADDIAYNNHDVEDGLRAGFFTLEDLRNVSLLGGILKKIEADMPDLSPKILIHETVREMIGSMVDDVLRETQSRLKDLAPRHADDIRLAKQAMVAFSSSMRAQVDELRAFLMARMYRHFTINRIRMKVDRIITDLFTAFTQTPDLLPPDWQARIHAQGAQGNPPLIARIVCDYIAGMTDRFAIREHERLFDLYWDLR